jgi:hypothetical protein
MDRSFVATTAGPRLGSTAPPVASPVITLPPTPADPAFLSREALRPCLGRTPLATMTAVKVARALHRGLVEPTAGQGWLSGCPGRLLSKFPARNCRRGRRIVDFNGRGRAKTSTF